METFNFQIPDVERLYPPSDDRRWRPSGPLVPFHPALLDPASVLGRTVEEWTPCAGTYGMGGAGRRHHGSPMERSMVPSRLRSDVRRGFIGAWYKPWVNAC